MAVNPEINDPRFVTALADAVGESQGQTQPLEDQSPEIGGANLKSLRRGGPEQHAGSVQAAMRTQVGLVPWGHLRQHRAASVVVFPGGGSEELPAMRPLSPLGALWLHRLGGPRPCS